MEHQLKQGQRLDLRVQGGGLGVTGEGCGIDLQRRYDQSEQQLGSVHGKKAAGCREREMEGHNIYGTSTGAGAFRKRKTGWLEAGGGTWNRVGDQGNKAGSLTHGRTHIQCSWSRSCRPSAHGQRRRFLWNYRLPCGNPHRPACQTPAPGR